MERIAWIYPGRFNVVTRVLRKERQEGGSLRRGYGSDMLLALKTEEGSQAKGGRWPTEVVKGKEILPWSLREAHCLADILILSQGHPLWPWDLRG